MNNVGWPDFLIVGAAKAGTTSLYYYLQQHSELYLTDPKEPCFFAFPGHDGVFAHEAHEFIASDKDYKSLFVGHNTGLIKGEATALYLYHHEDVIENIYKYVPSPKKVKIIIVLRNPLDRAFSQYMMLVRDGRETLSFDEAIREEESRKDAGYHSDYFYLGRGLYFQQVKGFIESFYEVKVLMFEDLIKQTKNVVDEVVEFLGVEKPGEMKPEGRFNVSGRPIFSSINRVLQSRNPVKKTLAAFIPKKTRERIKAEIFSRNSKKETMSAEAREFLRGFYKGDIHNLESLLERDLSAWLA